MNLISILGLVVLLGLAWSMSYHRWDVNLRTVFWGIGLQFVLALIILRQDFWSFVGMAVLTGLIIVYLLEKPRLDGSRNWRHGLLVLSIGLALGAVLTRLPARWLGTAAIVVLVVLAINSRFQFAGAARRYLTAVFFLLGVSWLISGQIYGQQVFEVFSSRVTGFLNLSDYGARFLFGNLSVLEYNFPNGETGWPGFGAIFAFKVLPTIIFFGGFMAVLYYLGVMQKVIESLARFMRWTIGTSGAETLSCTANVFVGQTEAPLLVRPFLDGMTRSELCTIMVGGFATIAGGVLAGFIAFGIPAGHLIAASVMSAPAALVMGKIIYPEKEHSQTAGDVKMPDVDAGGNVIEAATSGISDGLKLALNIGAMLIGFIALIAVMDVILRFFDGLIDGRLLGGTYVTYAASGMSPVTGEFQGLVPGSLQTLFGTILRPLAWLMGVPWADAARVGNLLGVKLSLNEFVAYATLGGYLEENLISERAATIATFALCGFANFSSIGIQIGGISALAPERRSDLAKVGLKAMFGGALASWMTATIAGILL